MRAVLGILTMAFMLIVAPAQAQDADEAAWQASITGQVQAFRDRDAVTAFSYAAAPFHVTFADSDSFFIAILSSGYEPIMDSASHSFGEFQKVADDDVVQDVKFIGTDLSRYEAFYELRLEEGGWRVVGVQLVKQPGIGV